MLNPRTIHSMPFWEMFSHLVVKKEGKNKPIKQLSSETFFAKAETYDYNMFTLWSLLENTVI